MKVAILKIEGISRWKFWKIDTHYITVNVDGKQKRVSIFDGCRTLLFLHYVKNKLLGLGQFERKVADDWESIYTQLKERELYDKGTEKLLNKEFEL